jgi:hypothetical protein
MKQLAPSSSRARGGAKRRNAETQSARCIGLTLVAALACAGCQPNGTPSEAQMRTAVEAYIQEEMGGPTTEDNGFAPRSPSSRRAIARTRRTVSSNARSL